MHPMRFLRHISLRHFDTTGLILGTLFFAVSLTPTLLPRADLVQAILSGVSFAVGYGVGVLGHRLWQYLELPEPRPRIQWYVQVIAASICGIIALVFLWQAGTWQNAVRELMGMEERGGLQLLMIAAVAALTFLILWLLGCLFGWIARSTSQRMQRFVPRRISNVAGVVLALAVFWTLIDGVFFSMALRSVDASYQQVDALMEPEFPAPEDPESVGGADSVLDWDDMGRHGRRFLSRGPSPAELQAFTGEPAPDPIRVYVGMHASDSPEERATLALEELRRVDAFDRSVLVLVTPTGTGWVDQAAMDPLEYLHRGDIASVAAQYSYLPSPVSLMAEGDYGAEMARALFREVYDYWTRLDPEERPELYLHGLSLGALNADLSHDLYDIIQDPFHGALYSGPPFRKQTWRDITERRQEDSPAWLPVFRDGSVVRFANQDGGLEEAEAEWGHYRVAYLQYASDPVTFFDPDSFIREPEWMQEPRGPDVSESLRWFPIVTGLQLAADMGVGVSPVGYGHDYAAEHYIDAWVALTEPEGWDEEDLERLRERFREKR